MSDGEHILEMIWNESIRRAREFLRKRLGESNPSMVGWERSKLEALPGQVQNVDERLTRIEIHLNGVVP